MRVTGSSGEMMTMYSKAAILARILWMSLVLAVAFTLPARAETPASGVLVRVQAWDIEVGWHQGKVVRAPNGCTQVRLTSPDASGHTSIALERIDWLEVRRGDSWSTVSIARLLSREPAACRSESADSRDARLATR
jgi:hypothetical protein